MRLIVDIETDGLLDEFTRVHSLVLRDADSGKLLLSCTDEPRGLAMGYRPIAEGLALMRQARTIYIHNGIRFDDPALRWLYEDGELYDRAVLVDTLAVVRTLWAHIKESDYGRARAGKLPGNLIGAHSLESWGYRLGVFKGGFGKTTDWSSWSPEMQAYCEQDTFVNYEMVRMIRREVANRAKEDGVDPMEAINLEMDLAWYLAAQERNGWPFDMDRAQELQIDLMGRRAELAEELRDHFGSWFAPGKLFTPKRDNRKLGYVAGSVCLKLKVVEFNPASTQNIAEGLKRMYGWEPTVFTETGLPQVDEKVLKGLKYDIVPKLQEYLLIQKRLGQLAEGKKAWLKLVSASGRHGGALTGKYHLHHSVGAVAVTHRHRHSHPNVGQVPTVEVSKETGELLWGADGKYGTDCRACFTIPAGWDIIGADASGLELRGLAHFMARYDGGAYGDVILNGDIHSHNQGALGNLVPAGKPGRDKAKTFIYAYLYGAGEEKLGSIVKPGASPAEQKKIGGKLRKQFEKEVPALGELQKAVKKALLPRVVKRDGRIVKVPPKGYLLMPDGRRTYIRHPHAALNSLLQSWGAIVVKKWIVNYAPELEKKYGRQGWLGLWAALAWVHDEVQIAVRPEIADEVKVILVEQLRRVTAQFATRLPLDGEAKVGKTWAHTH